jgi:aspartate/methionine/tyrosine aminotransferase
MSTPVPAARMENVQSPVIPVVAELIRDSPGTISLGQGVVGYAPPPQAMARLSDFLADPENHKYKPVDGVPALKSVLEEKLRSENTLAMDGAAALVVTAGGNMAFLNAVLAITDPGDEVIIQTPYYFNHEMAIAIAGCKAVLVPTDSEYQLRPGAVRQAITPRTRAIVTISPNNPTGAVYPESALREINGLCQTHGLYHIHDEAYEYFTYGRAKHFSPGSIAGSAAHTISLFSLSKAYGFASWRIGYMVAPAALLVAIKKAQDTILICPPVISQFAALGALEAGSAYCREKLVIITQVREIVLGELEELRDWCTVPQADGAFYFLLRLHTQMEAMAVVERLVREHRVAAIPGHAFGIDEGCTLRISYGALEPATAREGISRLVRGLKQILE